MSDVHSSSTSHVRLVAGVIVSWAYTFTMDLHATITIPASTLEPLYLGSQDPSLVKTLYDGYPNGVHSKELPLSYIFPSSHYNMAARSTVAVLYPMHAHTYL